MAHYAIHAEIDPNALTMDLDALPCMPELSGLFRSTVGPPIVPTHNSRRFLVEPGTAPSELFKPTINSCTVPAPRWVYTDSTGKSAVLIYTDGAAPNNGQPNVRAGCGIVLRPDGQGNICFPLENIPGHKLTSNRAELRAAHIALGLRVWSGEGFTKVVIGTDSEYVVRGACEWTAKWRRNGWVTSKGKPVKNKDLWEMLLKVVEELEAKGLAIKFYLLKREWNTEADACAKRGAESANNSTEFAQFHGVAV